MAGSTASATIDTALASALRLSVVRLNRRLRGQRADTSVTLTQLAALSTLKRHGALTPGELAAHEKVQPPSMTRVLAALDERGLVLRRPHPTDGRQALVELTAAGRRPAAQRGADAGGLAGPPAGRAVRGRAGECSARPAR